MCTLVVAGAEALAVVLGTNALILATVADGRASPAAAPGFSIQIRFDDLARQTDVVNPALSQALVENGPAFIERRTGIILCGGFRHARPPYLPVDSRGPLGLDSGLWSDFGTEPCAFTTGLSPLASQALEPTPAVPPACRDAVRDQGGRPVSRKANGHIHLAGLSMALARKSGCLALLVLVGLLVFRRRARGCQGFFVPRRARNRGGPRLDRHPIHVTGG